MADTREELDVPLALLLHPRVRAHRGELSFEGGRSKGRPVVINEMARNDTPLPFSSDCARSHHVHVLAR